MATKAPTKSKLPAKAPKRPVPAAKPVSNPALAPGPNAPLNGSISPLNVTIGVPDGNNNAADYPANPGPPVPPYSIDLSQYVPAGARIDAAWHIPMENIVDLTKFKTIRLDVAGDEVVKLSLHLAQAGRVRMRIHASYVPK